VTYRQIHTQVWKDGWVLELSPAEKLLFIYLFSNDRASMIGLYELPLKVIEFETGMARALILTTLAKFEAAGKVHYAHGIVWVVNMPKFQCTNLASPHVQRHMQRELQTAPACEFTVQVIARINALLLPAYHVDTVSTPYPHDMDTETHNQNQKQNQEEEITPPAKPETASPPENPPLAPEPLTAEPLTKAALEFFAQFHRKRWATPAQREAFEQCEREVGPDVMFDAVKWAATANINNIGSIISAARKMAREGKNGHRGVNGSTAPPVGSEVRPAHIRKTPTFLKGEHGD